MNVLDTSGLKCPLPVLKAKKALKQLSKGEKLKVIATDPGAIKDFHHFCEVTGDSLEKVSNNDGTIIFVISKCSQN
jgi:tRNA 2-thiouridine synthesizing protein A